MAKKVLKIDKFDGGINNHADEKDIEDNELVFAEDVMVDAHGRIRLMGGCEDHEAPAGLLDSASTKLGLTIEPGYGLYYFGQDATHGNLGEHLQGTGNSGDDFSGSYWTTSGSGWTVNSGTLVHSGSSATGYVEQTAANRMVKGVNSTSYAFGYTVTSPSNIVVTIEVGFAASQETLTVTAGTHEKIFTTASDANAQEFKLKAVTSGSGGITLDNLYLRPVTAETGDQYIMLADADATGEIYIYSKNQGSWGRNAITGRTNVDGGNRQEVFYNVDGNVRICDANFGNNNSNIWYGYINRSKFETSGSAAYTDKKWFKDTTTLTPPTIVDVNQGFTSGADLGADATHNLDALGEVGITIDFEVEPTDTVNYDIAASFVYDGTQESLLTVSTTVLNGGDDFLTNPFSAQTWIYAGTGAERLNPRLTHLKWYVRPNGGTDDAWYLIMQANLDKGTERIGVSDAYKNWSVIDGSGITTAYTDTWGVTYGHLGTTYDSETGRSWRDESLEARYKTAVVANRRLYAGNCKITDSTGQTKVFGDSMFVSPVDQYDVLHENMRDDVTLADGDEIVKLELFGDRLLQFKKNKLHILNIATFDNTILEATYDYRGVDAPYSVCKTEAGIVWANYNGVFLFDGQDVIDLFVKKNKRKIAIEDTSVQIETRDNSILLQRTSWRDFLTTDKSLDGSGTDTKLIPMVGHSPNRNKIIVFDNADYISSSSYTDPPVMVYDMITQSWTTGSQINKSHGRCVRAIKTNFINDYNGDLVYSFLRSGSHTSAGTSATVLTDSAGDFTDDMFNGYTIYNVTNDKLSSTTISDTDENDITHGALASSAVWNQNEVWRVDKAFISRWHDDAVPSTYGGDMFVVTKNYDFGQPGVRKKIYKIYVSYYGGDSLDIDVAYRLDGSEEDTWGQFDSNLTGADGWHIAELKPTVSIPNCYSFQLYFRATGNDNAPASFLINDISIVYRMKRVK